MQRYREITYHCNMIYDSNWAQMAAEGWRWHDNYKRADYTSVAHIIRHFQHELGRERVTVGQPFQVNRMSPYAYDESLLGLYLNDAHELVFTLHRDCDRWLKLPEDKLSTPEDW